MSCSAKSNSAFPSALTFAALLLAAAPAFAEEVAPVDPSVRLMVTSPVMKNAGNVVFRYVLKDEDYCLYIDRMAEAGKGPAKSYRLCKVEGPDYSLKKEDVKEAKYSGFTWKADKLAFSLVYQGSWPLAERWNLACSVKLDAQAEPVMQCR